jgi:hypothetical protein
MASDLEMNCMEDIRAQRNPAFSGTGLALAAWKTL